MSENKYPIGGYAPNSDARALAPTFDEMVGLIEKLFKDYLTDIGKICTPDEIERGWQRYKVLNHLYQDEPIKDSKCPVCKSENTKDASIRQNNGVIGPGFASWIVDEKWLCNDCGVYFKPIDK